MYPIGLLLATLLTVACGASEPPSRPAPAIAAAGAAVEPAETPAGGKLVAFLGDSLTAGYGLPRDEAFPSLVSERLRAHGIAVRVVNAGVSGDTTAGGLARLDWLLRQRPDVLVVCLGANDGLRGQPLSSTEENLRQIVERAKAAGTKVLLLGIRIPPSYGPEYADRFAEIYPDLAKRLDVPLMPFLLKDVAGHRDLNLDDGIHPNTAGQKIVAENVLPYLERLLGP
jgi:acyl-CoA thioesterase-1